MHSSYDIGQSTGKEVFTRRETVPDGRILTSQEIHFYKRMHIELEKKFIKSVLKSVIKGSLKVREILATDGFSQFAPISTDL